VQDREHDVHIGESAHAVTGVDDRDAARRRIWWEYDLRAGFVRDLREATALDCELGVTASEHPATGAGDADRYDLEFGGVERVENAVGADTGDRVLGAATAEDDRDPGLP
jgi:hypothetical protein